MPSKELLHELDQILAKYTTEVSRWIINVEGTSSNPNELRMLSEVGTNIGREISKLRIVILRFLVNNPNPVERPKDVLMSMGLLADNSNDSAE